MLFPNFQTTCMTTSNYLKLSLKILQDIFRYILPPPSSVEMEKRLLEFHSLLDGSNHNHLLLYHFLVYLQSQRMLSVSNQGNRGYQVTYLSNSKKFIVSVTVTKERSPGSVMFLATKVIFFIYKYFIYKLRRKAFIWQRYCIIQAHKYDKNKTTRPQNILLVGFLRTLI